jgi:Domain of unknown function (DUF6430)
VKSTMRAYLSAGYWRHGFSFTKLVGSLLIGLGALWTLTELLVFFELAPNAVTWLKERWYLFLAAGAAWAFWENRPYHAVGCTLVNRDVRIEVRVGDIFAGDHALVIGCNTSFDTDMASGRISGRSIQGQFTNRYYSDVAHLDADIDSALSDPTVPRPTQEQKAGKQNVYPIGTTLTIRPRGRTAYLCAIARMNSRGNAQATFDDIKRALPELWNHISSAGDHGDIVVPVLGSGPARVPENRPTLIREILRSFIAACAAQRLCNSLTVVVHPKDYYKFSMNLREIGDFLTHVCKYTDFAAPGAIGGGQPMPVGPAPGAAVTLAAQNAILPMR